MPRILVIEDEYAMRTVLANCLERHGYRVILAHDGASGLERALREKPDLILMDIMMPKLDGFAVCAELRRLEHKAPILILTAKSRMEDKVTGLDAGADDYLVKPFCREELLARVRALLRRFERQEKPVDKVTLGRVELDFAALRTWKDGAEIELTPKEFAMLRLLLEKPGEVVSRDRFLDVVWGCAAFPTTRTVDKHIVGLRHKIEENPEAPKWIVTVHGVGYRLERGAQPEGPKEGRGC